MRTKQIMCYSCDSMAQYVETAEESNNYRCTCECHSHWKEQQ